MSQSLQNYVVPDFVDLTSDGEEEGQEEQLVEGEQQPEVAEVRPEEEQRLQLLD